MFGDVFMICVIALRFSKHMFRVICCIKFFYADSRGDIHFGDLWLVRPYIFNIFQYLSEFGGGVPNGKCSARGVKRSSEACADWGVSDLSSVLLLLLLLLHRRSWAGWLAGCPAWFDPSDRH